MTIKPNPTAVPLADMTDNVLGALVRRSMQEQLAASAPALRQQAVLAQQAKAEAARERLSVEQAARREDVRTGRAWLPGFVRAGVAYPSLDLADVVFAEVAPEGVSRRFAAEGLTETSTWADVVGAHSKWAMLATQEPKVPLVYEPEPEPVIETVVPIETPANEPVEADPFEGENTWVAAHRRSREEDRKVAALMAVMGLSEDAARAVVAQG